MNGNAPKSRKECLAVTEWPDPDRRMWARITEPAASILDDAGPGAHWRPATRDKRQGDYGRWLGFLRSENLLDTTINPEDRIRPELVQRYVTSLRGRVTSFTVWSYLDGLFSVMSALAPERDRSWLRKMVNRLQRDARPSRKVEHRVLPARRLFETGIRRMREAERRPPRLALDRSSWYRDGLQIAFLIARPVRRRNLANIRIGHNLIRLEAGYQFHFPPEETKTSRPLDFSLPAELILWMHRYLDYHRPRLLQGNESDLLWVSNLGQGMTINSVGARICEVTEELFGVRISPQIFRKCAATTIAIERPEEIAIVRAILGHSNGRTAERHYIQASTIEASRRFGDSLDRRRRRLLKQFEV